MRFDDFRRSDDIEDDRATQRVAAAAACRAARGGLGIGTIIVLGLIGWYFGIDPRILIGGAQILTGGGAVTQQTEPRAAGHRRRADRRDGQIRRAGARRHRRPLERNLPGQRAEPITRRSCACSATPPTRAAAWRSRRWGRSIARPTSASISTPDFSARSRPGFTAARAMPASSPRPMSSPMRSAITCRTCSASCRG